MLLCDDNLGKHENSGFKYIKYNPGKQESTGSKKKIYIYIYMQFVNESCQGSSGDTAPFRVFTRRSKTAAKQ